jgi:subfamily B ATP-binding cassette protein MsbA
MSSSTKKVFAYLKPHKKKFILSLVCMAFFGATDGGVPLLLKSTLDGIFARHDKDILKILPFVLLGFALFRAVFDFLQSYLLSSVGHLIVRDLRNDLHRVLLSLEPGYFIKNSSADLVARSTSDVVLVRGVLTDTVAAVLRDSIRVVALLSVAIYLDPWLACIAFLVFPIGVYPVYKFGKKLRKLSRRGQEGIGTLSELMQESILGNRVVKVFNQEKLEQKLFDDANSTLTKVFIRSEFFKALTGPVNEILASAAMAGVVLYGGYSVIGGIRSSGEFISFLAALFLLYDPFKKLSRVSGTLQQGLSGADRIFQVLELEPSIKDPVSPKVLPAKFDLCFSNVSVWYNDPSQKALDKITVTIPQGKKFALVGLSGAGKSTFVDLIPRFIDPREGAVTLGGIDIREVTLKDLRDKIALVGQHTFLFNDTIYNNIAYGCDGATREQVEQAAKAAYAHDFISQLPAKYETMVGEGGLSLSGGERQRIAIARAIAKNAPILILDEATASLDNKSEREVQSALEALEKGRTTVVIAHRLSTIQNADEILVLREGKIVERGAHAELISKKGEFERLHALQFSSLTGTTFAVTQ